MGRLTGVLAIGVGVAVFLATPRTASAQPSVDDIYSDAKDVIAELIERDVAESIAPNLACYSPGGLLKYFPGTLQAIYERNFGAIKDVLRTETVAMVGNYAFESFRERRRIPLGEFLPAAQFDPLKGSQCTMQIKDLGGPGPYQDDLARKRRLLNDGNYLPLDACSGPEGPGAGIELPCLFAQAVIASAGGRSVDTEELLSTAVATTVTEVLKRYAQLPTPDAANFRRIVVDEVRARLTTGAFRPEGSLVVFAAPDFDKALALAAKPFKDILKDHSPDLRIRAGAIRMLAAPTDAPEITVSTPHAAQTSVPDLVAYLKGLNKDALAIQAGEGPGTAVARAVLVQAGKVPKGTVTVTNKGNGALIEFASVTTPTPAAFTGVGLARVFELYQMARMAGQFERVLGTAGATPIEIAAVRGVVGLVQALDSLGAALKSAGKTEGNGFDLMTLLDGVARGKFTDALCPKNNDAEMKQSLESTPVKTLSLCDVWKQVTGLMDSEGSLRPILAAARDRNYRALAVNAVSAIFSRATTEELCCGKEKSCTDSAALYGRLAKSFTSYVLMPRDDGDASLAARAAFKSAAVDVIRSAGQQGGVERRNSWRGFFLPSGSLRASWSSSYQDEDSRHTGLRYVPTVDWPTLRFALTTETSPVYFGCAINLTDGLAPFAELVSRQSTLTYVDQAYVLLTVVQPRISGVLAIPPLTKHTALALGASLRGAAPFDLKRQDAGGSEVFGYATIFGTAGVNDTHDWGDRFTRLLEVSAAVQYIP